MLGTARDLHLKEYRLEAAPGRGATSGFILVSSGSAAVETGVLGEWDTGATTGRQTLRLVAEDQVGNASEAALDVFVGGPERSLVLGDHEIFNLPEGVAAGPEGRIYVADTRRDRVAVFSATGTFLASSGGEEEGDDGRPRGAPTAGPDKASDAREENPAPKAKPLALNKPRGVAVDALGQVYVADSNNDRVLKLSATGQVLLEIGSRRGKDEGDSRPAAKGESGERGGVGGEVPSRGPRPGELKQPSGVALDAAGNIYVADTGNGRVQKFGPGGALLLAFALPPVARPCGAGPPCEAGSGGDGGEGSVAGPPRPVGIAVDEAGRISVADASGGRALVFDPAGRPLLEIAIPAPQEPAGGREMAGGEAAGKKGGAADSRDDDVRRGARPRPSGIAVDPSGGCILVSDSKNARVLKFDRLGRLTLAFGDHGKLHDDKPLPPETLFNKPSGLALGPGGDLLVADRNNERIQRLGLPTGSPPLIVPPPRMEAAVARGVVEAGEGGSVERADAGVRVPAGALSDDLKIMVSRPAPASADESQKARGRQSLQAAGVPVRYGPEGTSFDAPVTLTLPFDKALASALRLGDKDLKGYYFDPKKGAWEPLESEVDAKGGLVKAKTRHFSVYQALGKPGSGPATADAAQGPSPEFVLRDVYAFPSPARRQERPTIRVQVGLADSVNVTIYDVSGQPVHAASLGSAKVLDDGNGKGPQWTYDYAWDTSGVGSGVYIYVVTAKKAGHGDIKVVKKVAVLK